MLRFKLAGFPIEIHWSFFLVAALLGLNNDLRILLLWIGVVFVSVLIHEMGHALMGRHYGLHPKILLYAMGGLTSWQTGRRLSRGQSIFVSFAGPAAGLFLGAAVWGVTQVPMPELNPLGRIAFQFLILANIFWSLFNLLPVLPLDGGSIMRSIVHMVRGDDDRLPRQISMAVAGAGAAWAFLNGRTFLGFFALYFAIVNYQALKGITGPMFPGMPR